MFDLQLCCEEYSCSYFVRASDKSDVDALLYALRFPFIKIYSLSGDGDKLPLVRKRFTDNTRVQIFHNAHGHSFFEMSRMVPAAYPAVFALTAHENILVQWLSEISANRPRKQDIILVKNLESNDSLIFNQISRFFGYTHKVGLEDGVIQMIPAVTKGLEVSTALRASANH